MDRAAHLSNQPDFEDWEAADQPSDRRQVLRRQPPLWARLGRALRTDPALPHVQTETRTRSGDIQQREIEFAPYNQVACFPPGIGKQTNQINTYMNITSKWKYAPGLMLATIALLSTRTASADDLTSQSRAALQQPRSLSPSVPASMASRLVCKPTNQIALNSYSQPTIWMTKSIYFSNNKPDPHL